LRIIVLIALLASSVQAGPKHFLRTHKEVILADTFIFMAWSADAAISNKCQRLPGCIERNPLLGNHPGSSETWGYALGMASAISAGNLFVWNRAPATELRHMIWFWTGPFLLFDYFNIKSNVDTVQRLEQARARLSRP
jgi:hypothetical protein